jgi:hypothetical protein
VAVVSREQVLNVRLADVLCSPVPGVRCARIELGDRGLSAFSSVRSPNGDHVKTVKAKKPIDEYVKELLEGR